MLLTSSQIIIYLSYISIFHHKIHTFSLIRISFLYTHFPMDTSSSNRLQFDVEISRGKFVEITSILKGESTWTLWHRFNEEISTWIRLSKSTKYRQVLHADILTLFWRQIDVTFVLAVSTELFSALGTYSKLFWYSAESMFFSLKFY